MKKLFYLLILLLATQGYSQGTTPQKKFAILRIDNFTSDDNDESWSGSHPIYHNVDIFFVDETIVKTMQAITQGYKKIRRMTNKEDLKSEKISWYKRPENEDLRGRYSGFEGHNKQKGAPQCLTIEEIKRAMVDDFTKEQKEKIQEIWENKVVFLALENEDENKKGNLDPTWEKVTLVPENKKDWVAKSCKEHFGEHAALDTWYKQQNFPQQTPEASQAPEVESQKETTPTGQPVSETENETEHKTVGSSEPKSQANKDQGNNASTNNIEVMVLGVWSLIIGACAILYYSQRDKEMVKTIQT